MEAIPTNQENLVKNEVLPASTWRSIILPAMIILLIIFTGAAAGYFLANSGTGSSLPSLSGGQSNGSKAAKVAGVKDEKSFPDKTTGRMEVNDRSVVKDGSYKLIRPGGESKTAYLTSSLVDMAPYVGQCVEVWGQTFASQQAGWLMDVGYLEKTECPEGI